MNTERKIPFEPDLTAAKELVVKLESDINREKQRCLDDIDKLAMKQHDSEMTLLRIRRRNAMCTVATYDMEVHVLMVRRQIAEIEAIDVSHIPLVIVNTNAPR